jgi:hypothetical protein
VLRVIRLSGLDQGEAAALLAARQVDTGYQREILDLACGHPLALALCAQSPAEPPSALLHHLVGDIPSAAHERALAVCAQVQATTKTLLRAELGDDAEAMFD